MAVATPTRPGPLVIPSSSSPGINSAPAVPTLHNADRPQWPRSNSFHDASPFALDSRDLRHLFGHDDSASDASSPFASSASSQASLSVPASPTVGDPTKASTGDQMALPPDFAGLSVFGEAGPLAHHMTPRRYDSHGSTSSDTGAYTSWPPSHASSYASSSTLPHSPHAQSVATTAVPIRQTSWSQQQQEYDLNGGMAPQGIDLDPTPVAHHGWSAQQYPPGWYGAPASLVDPSVFGGEGGLPIPPLQMPPPQTGPSYSLRAGRARPGQYVDFVGGVNGDAASSDGEDEIQVDQDAGWAYRARTDASDDEYVPPPEDHDPNEGAWQHAEHPDTLDHSAYMPYLPPTYSPQQGEPSAPPTPTRRGRRTPIAAPGDPVHWQSQTTTATKQAAIARRKPGVHAKFKCPYCAESFTRQYNLRGHIRAHNNEKPFACDFPGCGKRFARAHDKRRHSDLHSTQCKFRCELCARPFRRLDALNRHVKLENEQLCTTQDGDGGRCLAHSDGHCEAARAHQALLGPGEANGDEGMTTLPSADDDLDFAV